MKKTRLFYFLKGYAVLLALQFFSIHTVCGQALKRYRGAFELANGTTGIAQYSFKEIRPDSTVFQGRFEFTSELKQAEGSNLVTQITQKGNYENGLKVGVWEFDMREHKIKVVNLRNFKAETAVESTIKRLKVTFDKGIAEGEWVLSTQQIGVSSEDTDSELTKITFQNGKAVGGFLHKHLTPQDSSSALGAFDLGGFFDGEWSLRYPFNGNEYQELRTYNKGILIGLELRNLTTNELIIKESFPRLRQRLEALEEATSPLPYRISEEAFGILFEDGYSENHPVIAAQYPGNTFLSTVFSHFKDLLQSPISPSWRGSVRPTISFGFTRRFEYQYPDYEAALLGYLQKDLSGLLATLDSVQKSPQLKIQALKNDSLAFFDAYAKTARRKIQVIEQTVAELRSDKFRFSNRDLYYQKGIPALSATDTVNYTFKNKDQQQVVVLGRGVGKPDSLVQQLLTYSENLRMVIRPYIFKLDEYVKLSFQEDELVQLDQTIVALMDSAQITYQSASTDLHKQIYKEFGHPRTNDLLSIYARTTAFEQKKKLGNELVKLQQTLLAIYPRIMEIAYIRQRADSLYTRFSPNPFFDRDIESKFRQGIYTRGIEILLPYLLNTLVNTDKIENFLETLATIERLDKALRTLAVSEDPEVQRLNNRLRRENQPERIKRLLLG